MSDRAPAAGDGRRTISRGRQPAAAVLVGVALLGCVGCERDPTPATPADMAPAAPADTRPADTTNESPDDQGTASALTLPPESTFAQHCARCHGPQGMFYARPFKHEGQELRQVIREMIEGPAGLEPTEADVDAMLAYHLRLREDGGGGGDHDGGE